MNFLGNLFYSFLYQPLLNILIFLYNITGGNLGLAVVLLTLITRLLLMPSSLKGVKSQRALNKIQPAIKDIQKKYANDKEKQMKAIMELYQEKKVSPFSGCLPLLIQLPIIIALYQVFLRGLKGDSLENWLYPFINHPTAINFSFLGILNLAESNIFLALLAGLLQFFQLKISMPEKQKNQGNDFGQAFQQQSIYFFPAITAIIVWNFGSVIGLYWICSMLFSIGEHYIVKKRYNI
jgi:YidC/Oxa1 family membrane protein insertase